MVDVYYEADIKPEPKPEPEVKPEPKPELKPEGKPKLEGDSGTRLKAKDVSAIQKSKKLANTGEETTNFGTLGLISLVAAAVASRKKQKQNYQNEQGVPKGLKKGYMKTNRYSGLLISKFAL